MSEHNGRRVGGVLKCKRCGLMKWTHWHLGKRSWKGTRSNVCNGTTFAALKGDSDE